MAYPVNHLVQGRHCAVGMLIKEDIHLFEVDGVMKCVEQRLFQVIREVCGQEAVRITDRCIIQVLEEGEEEGDSVYWSLLSLFISLRRGSFPEFVDAEDGAVSQRSTDPADARQVLREGGAVVNNTIHDSRAPPLRLNGGEFGLDPMIERCFLSYMENRPSIASSAGTKQPIWFMYTTRAICLRYTDFPLLFGPVTTVMGALNYAEVRPVCVRQWGWE